MEKVGRISLNQSHDWISNEIFSNPVFGTFYSPYWMMGGLKSQIELRIYPGNTSGYPGNTSGYPGNTSGYPGNTSGYPEKGSGYT